MYLTPVVLANLTACLVNPDLEITIAKFAE
jgi:hypothetical protein